MKTVIIIPAYNEAENIENVLNDISKNCPGVDTVVINDCSTDATVETLERLGARYISLPVNLGIGGGVQTGYIFARDNGYDIAVQFDGDGQHDAGYLHDLIEPLERGEADIAIGSRFIEKEGFQSTAMRRFGISFLSGLIRTISGVSVKDVTSGMRAANRKMITFFADNYAQYYPEPEAVLASGLAGAKIVEVPVKMRDRLGGESSISPLKSVYYMIKVTLAIILSGLFCHKKEKKI